MKKKIFILTLLSFWWSQGWTQSDSSYTLKKCIDYALQNSPTLKNAKLDEYIADAQIGEVKATGLHQIKAEASIIHNPKLQRMFLKGDNQFLQDSDPSTPIPDPNEVYAIPNFFQLKSSGNASATVSQLLFSSTFIVGLSAAKTYKELATRSFELSKVQTIENVIKAYYTTLINIERLKLLENNIRRSDTLLRETKAMHETGFAEKIDVFRIEVTYNNLVTEKTKFEKLYSLSYLLLKFQMGMPINDKLELAGSIAELDSKIASVNINQPVDITKRIEYNLLETEKLGNVLKLKSARSGYLPTLSAFGTLGASRMDNNLQRLVTNQWFDYSMFGLNFSLPVFDGFAKAHQVQKAKLQIQKSDISIYNLKNSIELQTQQSQFTLANNLQTLASQKRNLELSTEVSRIAKIKYQQGVGSNIEVVTAEGSLRESQTNYYNAVYDVIIANVDYQRSLGVLINE